MKIRTRILVSSLLIVLMIAGFGLFSWSQQKQIGQRVSFMKHGSMQEVVHVSQLSNSLHVSYGAIEEMLAESLRATWMDGVTQESMEEIADAKEKISRAITEAEQHLLSIGTATEESIALASFFEDNLAGDEEEELIQWYGNMGRSLIEFRQVVSTFLYAIDTLALEDAVIILEDEIEPLFRMVLLPNVDEFLVDSLSEMEVESATILNSTKKIGRMLFISLIIMLFMAIAISLSMSQKIYEPLVRLSDAASTIQKGEAVEPFTHSTRDEIGDLTDIFFKMVQLEKRQQHSIEKARQELELQNKALEQAVETRTEDLVSSNALLFDKIERQKVIEAQLSSSLDEKETLLKEIHHRVKNNLQIITSLLRLQAAQADDEESKKVLIESEMRIRSMALVHEKLYQSKNLETVDLGGYIQSLSVNLIQTYHSPNINTDLQVDSVMVQLDTAISCGLILNELMTNVIKHAFDPDQPGEMLITLVQKDSGLIELGVSDNGKGLPSDFDLDKTESLGLILLQSLGQQLNGKVELSSNNGTTVKVIF